jgi:hypothetical protein
LVLNIILRKNKLHTFRKPTSEDLENLSSTITVASGVTPTKDDFEKYSEE